MNEEILSFKTNSNGEVLTWETPRGEAAKTERSIEDRINYYIATQSLKVDDKVFIPKRSTVNTILTTWDIFKVHLIVEKDSYTLYTPNLKVKSNANHLKNRFTSYLHSFFTNRDS